MTTKSWPTAISVIPLPTSLDQLLSLP